VCLNSYAVFFKNVSHYTKNPPRYYSKCFMSSCEITRYSSQISMKLKFSPQIFEKLSIINIHGNPPRGSELFHADRRTGRWTDVQRDKHDKANSLFSRFYERA
jgi:hypothetical protein